MRTSPQRAGCGPRCAGVTDRASLPQPAPFCGLLLRSGIAFALAITCAGALSAQHQVTAHLRNGIYLGFATATDPSGVYDSPSGGVMVSDVVDRYVVDHHAGLYFGYTIDAEPVPGSKTLKVTIKPLSERSKKRLSEDTRTGSVLVSAPMPKFPDPQVINDGDTIALDLLVNRKTGVKVVDRITVSTQKLDIHEQPVKSQPPRDFTIGNVQLKLQSFQLQVNGETALNGGSIAGSLLGFFRPGRGTFLLSVVPREGYRFQKIAVVNGNRLSFFFEGERYEWISNSPILDSGGPWNVWVLFDRSTEPKGFLRGAAAGRNAGEYLIGAATTVRQFVSY